MLLERLGVEGVSAVSVLVLLGVWIYGRRASRYGSVAVGKAGRAGSYARAVAVVMLVLLLAGVISADIERARQLIQSGVRAIPTEGLPWF
ncbi:hypothetical protein [Haloplanus natans]|uniref:hypothetical protein n=1 Tax=Haloplanus natans TaxID=376171 RepID=UPI0012F8B215|nr:hypothetical protein [Haloplanus natans]